MIQRQGKTTHRDSDEQASVIRIAGIHGNRFWRSVWKGIENDRPAAAIGPSATSRAIEAPRDYVVDAHPRPAR